VHLDQNTEHIRSGTVFIVLSTVTFTAWLIIEIIDREFKKYKEMLHLRDREKNKDDPDCDDETKDGDEPS
jgi:hypothetical protein